MKQAAANENEKIDPLTRIQEEIKEVKRREQEYHRQLTSSATTTPTAAESFSLIDFDDAHENQHENDTNGNNNNNNKKLENNNDEHSLIIVHDNGNDSGNGFSISPVPAVAAVAVVTSLVVHEDNTSSLASSVNSKESLDEHHSDDSGISASSSPINDSANNNTNEGSKAVSGREQRYIGPNCYNMTPEPPQQKLKVRAMSTPHIGTAKPRQFAMNPAHKGVMQRFIASRGKLQLNNNNANANKIMLNSKTAAALLGNNAAVHATPPNTPVTPGLNASLLSDFATRDPAAIIIPTVTMTNVIERDAEGRPIRPGYVPVELKIQRELKDLKSRESELKKIRKIRQSTPDLLDSIDNENIETDEEEDSDIEHCYGPNQLRSAKSVSDFCDVTHSNNSISPRATPSPDFHSNKYGALRGGGMRPAMSLAQLCDLDPEEAPSSHRLIAQWESLIQQNA